MRGSVSERDRLLDLERGRHPSVGHAAAVLDRDEGEEAQELAGPPDLLLRCERRRPETVERALDGLASPDVGRRVACQGRGCQLVESRQRLPSGGGAALTPERRLEDVEVASGASALGRQARGEASLDRLVGSFERDPEAGLVGVEVVGPHRRKGLRCRALPFCQRGDRERRVRAGSGEPRRRPELADEQPALRLGEAASLEAREHPAVGAGEHRRLELRARCGQLHLVAADDGALGAAVGRL